VFRLQPLSGRIHQRHTREHLEEKRLLDATNQTCSRSPRGAYMSYTRPDLTEVKFPVSAGILLGLGLGGFFDGIVFHERLVSNQLG
jgi:hypothetical protein